ncbi:MAG: hypothetical protein E7558_00285 [Ruminococcaceae bacterium]|nr:hypothetical protein [Oscillospiraceae bacterium]
MKRSANGSGTIYKRKGVSKPYIVYGKAYLSEGVMKREYLGAFKTRKEAEERRIAYIINPEVRKSDLTFKEVYEDYIKTNRFRDLTRSTQDGYKAAYKHCARLYSVRFADLRTAQMQEIINDLASAGKSSSSVNKVKLLFSLLSTYAMQNDIITKNYSEFITLPKFEKTEKRALTDLEIYKIGEAAVNGNKTAQWVYYMIYSGWRISELLELTAFNYDGNEKVFTGGKKTAAGKNRAVPVHSNLQWIIDKQLAENGQTVFCMENGKPMTANYFRRYMFQPLLEELDIDREITPHITRHTFATKLKQAGADDFYRQKLLGHSSSTVTDIVYTHADIQSLRDTIELLGVKNVCSLYAV